MKIKSFLIKFSHVKDCGDGWSAQCPSHEDVNNSLNINIGDDGRILIHCFAGCSAQEIVAAVGLKTRDLFPPSRRTR
jgi:predicted protein tyrosine phosphatase